MKPLVRILAVAHKEFLQLSRDRLTFGMIIGIPLIQLLMFGFAINTDVRNISAAYVDEADTHLSRQFVSDITASQVISISQRVGSAQELNFLMDSGSVSLGIYLPDDFDRRVIERNRKAVQLLVDGTDPIILGVARQLTAMGVHFDSQTRVLGSKI